MLTGEIRDADYAPVQPLGNAFKLEFQRRWLRAGGWILTLPTASVQAEALLAHPGGGIVVRDGETGAVMFSGRLDLTGDGAATAARREVSTQSGAERDVTTFTGTADFGVLDDRVVEPDPTLTLPTDHDERSGVASTVLLGLMSDHAGPTAHPDRVTPHLVVAADPVVGSSVVVEGRWALLSEIVREKCVEGGVVAEVVQQDRQLVASIRETVDRSADVVFGLGAHNIAHAVVSASLTEATHVVVAGRGEMADRNVARVAVPGTPARRVERFLDRRQTDAGELASAGETWLAENGGELSLTVDPVESQGAVLGVDYHVGDLVGVDLGGGRLSLRLVGLNVTATPRRVDRELVVGTEASTGDAALLRTLAAQNRRVSNLERR